MAKPEPEDLRASEEALVDAFIVPAKRARYRLLLAGARRAQILRGLDHLRDLDPRYATEIPSGADVAALLRRRGAPELCHLVSVVKELDGRQMPLTEALARIETGMGGTLIGCLPGRLAYYYGESGERRMLLERSG